MRKPLQMFGFWSGMLGWNMAAMCRSVADGNFSSSVLVGLVCVWAYFEKRERYRSLTAALDA